MIDLAGGEPRQITDYEDNVSFVRWLPDGKGLIFGKARGGDENTQFFLFGNDGGLGAPRADQRPQGPP